MPRCYIAGPMRGYPQYNFDAFDDAKMDLQKWGYDVISPADLDRLLEGWAVYPPDELTGDPRRFIRRDLEVILALDPATDILVLLPGWERSKGACAEVALASFCGIKCCPLTDMMMEHANG